MRLIKYYVWCMSKENDLTVGREIWIKVFSLACDIQLPYFYEALAMSLPDEDILDKDYQQRKTCCSDIC